MIILAIETSCDETAIALVEAKKKSLKVLSNIVSSQVKIHAPFGGVVPNLAKREHQKNLALVLKSALQKAKKSLKSIDLIAVTHGPGLEPALWTGVNFARALSCFWNKPIIGIDHMEGHLAAILLQQNSSEKSKRTLRGAFGSKNQKSKIAIKFPILALLVSGGHTQLVLIKKFGKYKIIGETRDDAAGEAFDKVARLLDLGYPGGPAIARLAEQFRKEQRGDFSASGWQWDHSEKIKMEAGLKNHPFVRIQLPRPMINSPDYDFSFSGLKTAVLYLVKDLKERGVNIKKVAPAIAAEFQQAVVDVLIKKTLAAAKEFKVKTIILGGGVAANNSLRNCLQLKIKEQKSNIKLLMPSKNLCTDNAAMIAAAAAFHPKKEWRKYHQIKATANLRLA